MASTLMKPLYISDLIKDSLAWGLSPVLMPGKKLVMLFFCPHCKTPKKMVKFRQGKSVKTMSACCGTVRHSPLFDHSIYGDTKVKYPER